MAAHRLPDSLHESATYIFTLETHQALKVFFPEEVSWRLGWIDDTQPECVVLPLKRSG